MVHRLESGMQVVLQENHAAPVVAIQLWVNVGSADDPQRSSGLAHVLEHMVFKGTRERSEGEIAQQIEGAGGQINAWTSFDQTVYHVVIASRFFDRGLEVLADAIRNSRLDDAELARELKVILEEIKQGEDSPSRVVSRNLFNTAYQRHTYRRPVIGHVDTVRRLTAKQVRRFHDRWYVPANMTLVVVGDFASTSILRWIQGLFGPRRGSQSRPRRKKVEEPSQRRLRITVKQRETAESLVAMAFHIPALLHPDTPVLDIAAVILGQGESARLTRKVKHELQLATTCYAYAYTPEDPGLLVIGATSPPARLEPVVQEVAREALALGAVEVSASELQRAKTLIESDAVYQKETVQGQARKLGFYQSVARTLAFEEEYNRRIREVTPAQLRQVAARYLRPQHMSISVVTPRAAAVRDERDLTARLTRTVERVQAEVAQGATPLTQRGDAVVKITLPGGTRLMVIPDDTVPLVAMRAVWQGGLRHETDADNGINSLLAALITRGTATRSADQINEAVEGMAGSISGFTGQNSFGIHAELLSRHWEEGLEILADCLLNPSFTPQEVERQRRTLIEDILAQEDNLSSVVMRLFAQTLFQQHPYRMDALGTVTSVSALTREQLVQYYGRHYPAGSLVLAVVGDVDPVQVAGRFRQLMSSGRRVKPVAVQIPRETLPREPREAFRLVKKEQAHLVLGYPGATLRSNDRYVLEVLTSVLSGQGGRLFTELRDRQGLAYQVGAYSQEGLEPGFIAVYIATSPERIPQAMTGIEQQLQRLRDHAVPRAELQRVQRYLVGSYEISLQSRSTLASYLAFNECYGLGYQAYARYAPSILAVTARDVQRVARKYLVDSRRVVAVVKPEEFSSGAARRVDGSPRAGVVAPGQESTKGKTSKGKTPKGKGQSAKARSPGKR